MGKMKRTNLVWDKYMPYLIEAINESKFMKRAEIKPMATLKMAKESHISTRASHLRESADVAKKIAEGLGLNEELIYAAMLMHDAGHPFSAHEGEELFNDLGEIFNTQFFHHNAKGIEVILSEDICGKAISKIPNIDSNPQLREKLKEEFYYFLDIIISHDGEASQKDMSKQEIQYKDIREAVEAKLESANCHDSYKFISQTPEGKLAKFADVFAYLSSDMQDAFRTGILKDFNDDYYKLFGSMFAPEYPRTDKDKIEAGKAFVEQMKKENLREQNDAIDYLKKQDEDIKKAINNIFDKIKEKEIDVKTCRVEELEKIIKAEKEDFRQRKIQQFLKSKGKDLSSEEIQVLENQILQKNQDDIELDEFEDEFSEILNTIESKISRIEEFTKKIIQTRSGPVYHIANKIKQFFINDLIKNSQNSNTPQLSASAWDFYWTAKKLNYKHYVMYSNWDYQTNELPKAVMEILPKCADALIKSGIIRNKFYDENVRKHIKEPKILKYMKTKLKNRRQEEEYNKKMGFGIRELKSTTRPSSDIYVAETTEQKQQMEMMTLITSIKNYVQNKEQVFGISYANTFKSLESRIRKKVNKALSGKTPDKKSLYSKQLKEQLEEYRTIIIGKYGTLKLSDEQKEEFIRELVDQEQKTMEYKMAIQLSADYLAGMTDNSIVDTLVKTGHMEPNVVFSGERGNTESDSVIAVVESHNDTGEER